ncbi:hypothetical protein T492DRAFT_1146328 [Pavlovales sp. CCMP2436]|nr:hypothetical protein T492DRAFT_1146328 [Pavlovales sp. CCMP2436]
MGACQSAAIEADEGVGADVAHIKLDHATAPVDLRRARSRRSTQPDPQTQTQLATPFRSAAHGSPSLPSTPDALLLASSGALGNRLTSKLSPKCIHGVQQRAQFDAEGGEHAASARNSLFHIYKNGVFEGDDKVLFDIIYSKGRDLVAIGRELCTLQSYRREVRGLLFRGRNVEYDLVNCQRGQEEDLVTGFRIFDALFVEPLADPANTPLVLADLADAANAAIEELFPQWKLQAGNSHRHRVAADGVPDPRDAEGVCHEQE